MPGPALTLATSARPAVLVVAASAEANAAFDGAGAPRTADTWCHHRLNDRLGLLISGIGKANAGAATARLVDPATTSCVVSLGLAGALPGSGLRPGDVVVATRSVFADEGLLTPDGFQTCAEMGLPIAPHGDEPPASPAILGTLEADARAPVATVSTCSGTDEAARLVVARTGAVAEAMEGAAVLLVAARLGIPGVEVRIISNTTGDRARQRWDLAGALARLERVVREF
jgi:futalosine hydrolase